VNTVKNLWVSLKAGHFVTELLLASQGLLSVELVIMSLR
jgi:hypothetical protein